MEPSTDFVKLAMRLEREAFARELPFPFLFAINAPAKPDAPLFEDATSLYPDGAEPPATQVHIERMLVLAVRKVHTMIPHSIILGRAPTSDILIQDRQISKTHALFQGSGSDWALSDAGSRNGTWVGHQRLEPKGDAVTLQSGDVLSFGHRAFLFLDAGDCWDRIRSESL